MGRAFLPALALAAAVALAVFFVLRFVDSERQRDLYAWQQRMDIVAESRLAALDNWLERQFGAVRALAQNTSLELYLTELANLKGTGELTGEEPEFGYLRNLLAATAEAQGFADRSGGEEIPANVTRLALAGLALFDRDGKPVVATRTMPVDDAGLLGALHDSAPGERRLIDLARGADGEPRIGFLVPVYALQSDETAASQIGWVAGLKPVARELYPLLRQPGLNEASAEVLLVRASGGAVEYLSPRKDGAPPLSRKVALDTPELDAAFGLATPGGFALKRNYRGEEVLVAARPVAGTGWTLLYTVNAEEALADSDARAARLLTVLLLALALAAASLIAVWRHATSRRSAEAAARYRKLAERLEHQERLLRLVTDSQPTAILILDSAMRVSFANARAAEEAGVAQEDMTGKTLASLIGPAEARPLEALCREAIARGRSETAERRSEEPGKPLKVFQYRHIPLPRSAAQGDRVLLVKEDVTAAALEREKREHELEDLVGALVGVVDRRDPFAAHHSKRTAEVAQAIADEMGLDAEATKTVGAAARLMNLGKILVPEALLAAERRLTEEELARVRRSILTSADLLEGVNFEGPLAETLRQMLEHWDGSGIPRGLTGDAILPGARIVAVANAFVGLVSARAYRDGLDFNPAIDELLKEAGRKYDRGVVAALINHLDNKGGRRRWAHFRRQPEGTGA